MKMFVSGIAGFLGSHLADALLAEGHEVVGADNLLGGYRDNVPTGVQFHELDVADFEALLGRVLAKLGKLREAVSHLSTVLRIRPRLFTALRERGEVYELLEEHELARRDFLRATQVRPDHRLGHYLLGRVLAKMGRKREALKALDISIQLDLQQNGANLDPRACLLRIQLRLEVGRYKQAGDECIELLKVPRLSEGYRRRVRQLLAKAEEAAQRTGK